MSMAENQSVQATAERAEEAEQSVREEVQSEPRETAKATLSEGEEVKKAEFQPISEDGSKKVPESMGLLMDVSLPVTIELGRTSMQIKDIMGLGEGAVVELERSTAEPVDIIVGGRLLGRGEVVVVNGRFGVRITELINPVQGGKQ